MVLITCDIPVHDRKGRKRLERVVKKCQNYGQRVQNSVFECLIEPATLEEIKRSIEEMIDDAQDTVRFYNLGSNWKVRIDSIGANRMYDPEGPLII